MDATALAAYVGASQNPADLRLLEASLTQAEALVHHKIGQVTDVPAEVQELAIREVAADLYHRRRVRNGVATFTGDDLTPIHVTRDPMRAAADILAPFLGVGIA